MIYLPSAQGGRFYGQHHLTIAIAITFLILAVIASWISARVGQRDEPELIDFPGSGWLIKPRRKKVRFSREWWSNGFKA
ncbi:MAG: hypothetical protein K8L97_28875 [Anaerolineae bacterium]|nr:hypothetical protein [Anaerolineae bacterium]